MVLIRLTSEDVNIIIYTKFVGKVGQVEQPFMNQQMNHLEGAERTIGSCCSSNSNDPDDSYLSTFHNQKPEKWIIGSIVTPVGLVPRVDSHWLWQDYWGAWKVRLSNFRMKYAVTPGLYAIGKPDKEAPVLVTANYKLSFDVLRRSLSAIDAWILVLNTKSINVWCAAGKGTFGTRELIDKINKTRLETVVKHKKVIIPQLGAVGVRAAEVKKATGFRVLFGPVYARDISEYIKKGNKATYQMRRVHFNFIDRIILTPLELRPAFKYFFYYVLIILLFFGIQPTGIIFHEAWQGSQAFLILGFLSLIAGAFFTPIFLPYIPFRSFAVKGWLMGLFVTFVAINWFSSMNLNDPLLVAFSYLFYPMVSSYLALQFTGSSTYTNMSGVEKELRTSIPIYFCIGGFALVLVIISKLIKVNII